MSLDYDLLLLLRHSQKDVSTLQWSPVTRVIAEIELRLFCWLLSDNQREGRVFQRYAPPFIQFYVFLRSKFLCCLLLRVSFKKKNRPLVFQTRDVFEIRNRLLDEGPEWWESQNWDEYCIAGWRSVVRKLARTELNYVEHNRIDRGFV